MPGGTSRWDGRDDINHLHKELAVFVAHTIVSVAATAAFAVGTPSVGTVPDGSAHDGLSAEDVCVVQAALDSGDPRRVRIAREVLRGQAGVVALADPWILHHHRVDTSRPCPRS
jgi:hypothetical protein